ncbi:MAG: ABC transporter ATP-binding protein [Candidatus Rokubacteria bacterium GWC2_70_16]|nr:MAG: ABC transporter ATP-binding protein [Candidatus Rokubacteria bacterium GWC2_70_16]
MALLEVSHLTKRFAGLTALDAVSFTVEASEILGLFGPNGAGKTTCFHCLSGFALPEGGRVVFDGRDITGRAPHALARRGIARTFQIVRPFRGLTALDNVRVALGHGEYAGASAVFRSWRGAGPRRAALALLDRVGLGAVAERQAGLLPLGMLKRLEVARALALAPRLVLLDEPLGGLAPEEMAGMAALIASLRAEGLSLVLVEHQMRVAMSLVDRVVVLDHGVVIAEGPPEAIRRDRRVIEAYLGETPEGDARAAGH